MRKPLVIRPTVPRGDPADSYSSETTSILVRARLSQKRGRTAEARTLLEEYIVKHPECMPVQRMLDDICTEQAVDACHDNEATTQVSVLESSDWGTAVAALLVGGLFFYGALTVGIRDIGWYIRSGRPGYMYQTVLRYSNPVREPLSDWIGQWLFCLCLGSVLLVGAALRIVELMRNRRFTS